MDGRAFLFSGACFALTHRSMRAQAISAASPDTSESVIVSLLTRLHQDQPRRAEPLLLMRNPFTTGQMVVTTATYTPLQRATHQAPDLYLDPPEDSVADAKQLAVGYNETLNTRLSLLSDSLRLNFPHVLQDEEDTRQFFALYPQGNVYSRELEVVAKRVPKRYRRLFRGVTSICSVSRVGFNAARTLAVIGVRQQGGSCSSEGWTVLARSAEDDWEPLHWDSTRIANCA